MKPITEEQRQALIAECNEQIEILKNLIFNGSYDEDNSNLESQLLVQEIALASLTAEPVAWVIHARGGDQLSQDGSYVANAEGMFGLKATSLYTAPPVPVIELPNDTCLLAQFARIYSALSIREHRHITRMVLNEVKRLNGLE